MSETWTCEGCGAQREGRLYCPDCDMLKENSDSIATHHEARIKQLMSEAILTNKQLAQVLREVALQLPESWIATTGLKVRADGLDPPPPQKPIVLCSQVQWFPSQLVPCKQDRVAIARINGKLYYNWDDADGSTVFFDLDKNEVDCEYVDDCKEVAN